MFQRKCYLQSQNFKRKFQTSLEVCLGQAMEINSPSKEEGLRDIRHKISMVLDTKFWESMVVVVSYLFHYKTLL